MFPIRPDDTLAESLPDPAGSPEFACVMRGLLSPETPEDVQFLGFELAVSRADYWGEDMHELPTSFLDISDRPTIDLILSHLNSWDCGLRFVWTKSGGVIRITTGAGGYWSFVGRGNLLVSSNQPTMNLQGIGLRTPLAELRRVVPHEGFHAMGGVHEHLRLEIVRDINPAAAYPYYYRWQGWRPPIVDANVLRALDEATIMGTPVDVDSIMGYPIVAEITYSGRSYPGGAVISPSDRRFAQKIYPKPSAPPVVSPPVSPPVDPPVSKPPDPVPTPPEIVNLIPGQWSEDFPYRPPDPLLFRFTVKRAGMFLVEVEGTGPFRVAVIVDSIGRGVVLATEDRSSRNKSRLAAKLRAGTYLAVVARKQAVVGVVRTRVSVAKG